MQKKAFYICVVKRKDKQVIHIAAIVNNESSNR